VLSFYFFLIAEDFQVDNELSKLIENITEQVLIRLKSQEVFVSPGDSQSMTKEQELKNIARMIDHTLLKPEATYDEIKQLCEEAVEFGFASVCVNSGNVPMAVEMLKQSSIPVCSVVGFPLGAMATKIKVFETKDAIENGAKEIDMVINIGALKSRDYSRVRSDIEEVVIAAKKRALVKVIIETCLLTDEEKIKVCEIAREAGADFVKTSTGFSKGGATVDDIRLMRRAVGPNIGVKASGGVSDYKVATDMLDAGACTLGDNNLCRIGTSKSINIIKKP
jgi:deoxyribose-phosphate aldolase